jgi:hypothetical protein
MQVLHVNIILGIKLITKAIKRPSPLAGEGVMQSMTDEGLMMAARTSSPCSAGTFSFKEKGFCSSFFPRGERNYDAVLNHPPNNSFIFSPASAATLLVSAWEGAPPKRPAP